MSLKRISREYRSKGSDRIQINSLLAGVSIGAISLLLSFPKQRISEAVLVQLAMAIPLLVTSSLSYAKTCYREIDEFKKWDNLGWITNSLGYIMILNSVALLLYQNEYHIGFWLFFSSSIILFGAYSILDVVSHHKRMKEKSLKFIFYILIFILGTFWPIFLT